MKAKSIKGITAAAIKIELEENMADGFKPTVAIVFLSDRSKVEPVTDVFDKKGIQVFGVSAFGQFIDKEHDTDSIAVLLLELKPEYFKIELLKTGTSSTKEIAKTIGETGKKLFSSAIISCIACRYF